MSKSRISAARRLDSMLGYQMRRASSFLMTDLADRLAVIGLRTTEASILVMLEADPLLTQAELGRRLGIKRANMAPLMAGLSGRGLVDRMQGEGASRPLKLSKSGKDLAAEAWRQMEQHDADYFGQFDAKDRAKLEVMLGKLWRDVES